MSINVATPIAVSCIDCHEDMHVELQETSDYTDTILVFVGCKCGRRIGTIPHMRMRRDPLRFASSDLTPIDVDSIGSYGKEMIERGRETMLRGERYIAAAMWVRG